MPPTAVTDASIGRQGMGGGVWMGGGAGGGDGGLGGGQGLGGIGGAGDGAGGGEGRQVFTHDLSFVNDEEGCGMVPLRPS